jgi:hypothetical protein
VNDFVLALPAPLLDALQSRAAGFRAHPLQVRRFSGTEMYGGVHSWQDNLLLHKCLRSVGALVAYVRETFGYRCAAVIRTLSDRMTTSRLARPDTTQLTDGNAERGASSAGITTLRRVIANTPTHVLLATDDHPEQPLRVIARAIAEEARAVDAVRAERLLIDLRRAWRDIPEARRLEPHVHEELWDRLVRTCIEEFYRAGS